MNAVTLDDVWLKLQAALLCGQLPFNKWILGAQMSNRSRQVKVAIWMQIRDKSRCKQVGRAFRTLLESGLRINSKKLNKRHIEFETFEDSGHVMYTC